MFMRRVCHKSEKGGIAGGLKWLRGLKIFRSPLKKSEGNNGITKFTELTELLKERFRTEG
jgi:hypothetical protein